MDLADIARQLDEDEKERMAEGDVTSHDYQEFLKVFTSYKVAPKGFHLYCNMAIVLCYTSKASFLSFSFYQFIKITQNVIIKNKTVSFNPQW